VLAGSAAAAAVVLRICQRVKLDLAAVLAVLYLTRAVVVRLAGVVLAWGVVFLCKAEL